MGKRIYFGHPLNTYKNPLEQFLLQKIQAFFPDFEIENPNQKHHDTYYRIWKEKTGNGMNYFYNAVLPVCDAGIFLPLRDGMYTSGVVGEIEWFLKRKLPVWQIDADGNVAELKLEESRILSNEETTERISKPY